MVSWQRHSKALADVVLRLAEAGQEVEPGFDGRPLRSYRSYVYGAVCIRRDYRRRGLLRGLYEAQKQDLAGQFDIGVAFVSRSNPHSLDAHIAGLGMTEVGNFELMRNVYVILAFRLPPKPTF